MTEVSRTGFVQREVLFLKLEVISRFHNTITFEMNQKYRL